MGIINSLSSKFKAGVSYLGNLAKAREESKPTWAEKGKASDKLPVQIDVSTNITKEEVAGFEEALSDIAKHTAPVKKAKKAKKVETERPLARSVRNARASNRGVSFDNHSLRNRACSCGSGKKFKKCCLSKMRIGAYQAYLAAVARAEKTNKKAA